MNYCDCDDYCAYCHPEMCEDFGHCRVCNGYLTYLGTLGALVWLKCQNCGLEVSRRESK